MDKTIDVRIDVLVDIAVINFKTCKDFWSDRDTHADMTALRLGNFSVPYISVIIEEGRVDAKGTCNLSFHIDGNGKLFRIRREDF